MDPSNKVDEKQIRELVDRGSKLTRETRLLEKKNDELNLIKAKLRELANGHDAVFRGTKGAAAMVEQKKDSICRVVPAVLLPRVLKLAGESIEKLFTFHPSKFDKASFEVNALATLPKGKAHSLLTLLKAGATAWVRFNV